ncbi:MAG: tRNA-dihydrouridine synthase family protein [Clostridium sp.]|nr:tRNA-dihydrouridine synthase family protein [Clostridium sp.]
MKYYLAPLEGITSFIYRNAYAEVFNDIDKYYAPFVVPNQSRSLRTKEFFDILPENNEGINLIPQILTNDAEGFILTAYKMKKLGYDEVNLNLGCPSSTVVSKDRGSGFLAFPEELDKFLYEIFNASSNLENHMKISIKTRIGKDSSEEFYKLLEIYNKYPVEELIIHPRTQKDFYGNKPDMNMFKYAVSNSQNTLCYNGDIFTADNYKEIEEKINCEEIKEVDKFMFGRGIIANPGLIYEIKNNRVVPKQKLKEFHDKILNSHLDKYDNERNILFKMKEILSYMIYIFSNNKSYSLEIKRSQDINEYTEIVNRLFREQEIIKGAGLFTR